MGSIAPPHAQTAERFRLAQDGSYVADPAGNIIAPASAKPGRIAVLDPEFAHDAGEHGLCSVCAGEFGDDAVYVFVQATGAEPPMHVRCALYAALACPYLRGMAAERAAENDTFDFLLVDRYTFDDGDDEPTGLFYFSPARVIRMPYERFVRYARAISANPVFSDLATELSDLLQEPAA